MNARRRLGFQRYQTLVRPVLRLQAKRWRIKAAFPQGWLTSMRGEFSYNRGENGLLTITHKVSSATNHKFLGGSVGTLKCGDLVVGTEQKRTFIELRPSHRGNIPGKTRRGQKSGLTRTVLPH